MIVQLAIMAIIIILPILVLDVMRVTIIPPPVQITKVQVSQRIAKLVILKPFGILPLLIMMVCISLFILGNIGKARHGIVVQNVIPTLTIIQIILVFSAIGRTKWMTSTRMRMVMHI